MVEVTGTPGSGSDNPVLSFNLEQISDWSTALPFINLAHTMRPWIGHSATQWEAMNFDALKAGGYLDANGWVKEIPPGLTSIGSYFAEQSASAGRVGNFVLLYEGQGTVTVSNATILSSEPGRITFKTDGGPFWFDITSTDPGHNGDYIRDIAIVHEEKLPLHEAGALFNPDWLEVIEDARDLRFMDWMGTNNSAQGIWSNRPTETSYSWYNSAPVEVMVRLSNETGTNPWFTIPHLADDDYIRRFAEYVRDHLDPSLVARVEYSNEVWNWSFGQTPWLLSQSRSEWGVDAQLDYAAKRATETALIWEDVFSGASYPTATLVNVLGSQGANPWITGRLLEAPVWAEHEPDNYVAPSTVFEEVAITNYFGGTVVSEVDKRLELLSRIAISPADAANWLRDRLLDPAFSGSIPYDQQQWIGNAAVAHSYGLDLVAYEGGQHVQHSFAINGLSDLQLGQLTNFLTDFVRGPHMAELYQALWSAWAEVSDGPFMQFVETAPASKWGSWGLLSHLGDSTPRSEVLFELAETQNPWWEAAPNAAHLQGAQQIGNSTDEHLTGTVQEDFLAGLGGNDMLVGGAGNDGLNGGDGADTLQGDAGDDRLWGANGADLLYGGTGNDDLDGGNHNDWLFGREGDDSLRGGDGNDVLAGGSGNDLIDGGLGNDVAYYRDANEGIRLDMIENSRNVGEPAFDQILGVENIWGSRHDDVILGDNAGGQVYGFEGNDVLDGRGGSDVFYGGAGSDNLTGGAGADIFFVLSWDDHYNIYGTFEGYEGGDTITDFEQGVDHLVVSRYWFGYGNIEGAAAALTTTHANFVINGAAPSSAAPTFVWDASTGSLHFDPDGDSDLGSVHIATLTPGTNLQLSDIWTA